MIIAKNKALLSLEMIKVITERTVSSHINKLNGSDICWKNSRTWFFSFIPDSLFNPFLYSKIYAFYWESPLAKSTWKFYASSSKLYLCSSISFKDKNLSYFLFSFSSSFFSFFRFFFILACLSFKTFFTFLIRIMSSSLWALCLVIV